MYVHIGKDNIIKTEKIIAIINLEKMLEYKKLDEILKQYKIEENTINISKDSNKSLIIIKEDNIVKGYISNISSTTLSKRIEKEII